MILVSAYLLYYYFVGIKDPYITGYVTDIQDNRALIISGELDEDTDLFPASWLRIPYLTQITGDPKIGQKVEASVKDIITQSYPSGGQASKMRVLPHPPYPEANLNKREVIELSLNSIEEHKDAMRVLISDEDLLKGKMEPKASDRMRALTDITFNKDQLKWTITMVLIFNFDEEHKIIINDSTGKVLEIADSKEIQ